MVENKYIKSILNAIREYNLISYSGLLLMFILFFIFSGNKLSYNIGVLIQTASPYMVVALGGVFIYSLGNLDISIGQQIGVYVILMILITNALGATFLALFVSFVVILILALLSGMFNAYASVQLRLPAIVTSLFLMFFFTGAQFLLMESTGTNSINIGLRIKPEDRDMYNLLLVGIVVGVAIIYTYLYKYTRLGKYIRAIGANEQVAKQSGINTTKWKMLAYAAFAATLAIGAFMMLMRTGAAGKGTGAGYHLDLMVILILGGMPLSGGMKSRISSAIIGALIFRLLSSVLATMGVGLELINFIKAIIFIVIVILTTRSKELGLPR